MGEYYRPTPEQISAAKMGSNELFEFDVPIHLQPNNLRHSENLSRFTGFLKGIYYQDGVPRKKEPIQFTDEPGITSVFKYNGSCP